MKNCFKERETCSVQIVLVPHDNYFYHSLMVMYRWWSASNCQAVNTLHTVYLWSPVLVSRYVCCLLSFNTTQPGLKPLKLFWKACFSLNHLICLFPTVFNPIYRLNGHLLSTLLSHLQSEDVKTRQVLLFQLLDLSVCDYKNNSRMSL